MIKCRFCQAIHVNNTVFCSDCGGYLLEDDARETDALDVDEIGWTNGAVAISKDAPLANHRDPRPLAVRFIIGDNKREVEPVMSQVTHVLGRVDPVSNVFPEIDLSDDGHLAKSVSRRHARIIKQKNSVFVEDLGSINGTFVNGKRLQPYVPETLHDGDILQLGKLPIRVKIRKQEVY
ncbi:MAG: FHA domain-containing protein [Anaerolineae bacterium]|nr:FHA domain-containing protein [Anaerolineae bacterium]